MKPYAELVIVQVDEQVIDVPALFGTPTNVQIKGGARRFGKGVHDANTWTYKFEVTHFGEAIVQMILERFAPPIKILREKCRCTIGICIVVDCAEEDRPSLVFERDLLKRLVDLDVSLEIDLT